MKLDEFIGKVLADIRDGAQGERIPNVIRFNVPILVSDDGIVVVSQSEHHISFDIYPEEKKDR